MLTIEITHAVWHSKTLILKVEKMYIRNKWYMQQIINIDNVPVQYVLYMQ